MPIAKVSKYIDEEVDDGYTSSTFGSAHNKEIDNFKSKKRKNLRRKRSLNRFFIFSPFIDNPLLEGFGSCA